MALTPRAPPVIWFIAFFSVFSVVLIISTWYAVKLLSILHLWILCLNCGMNWFEYLHTVFADVRIRELVWYHKKNLIGSQNRFSILSILHLQFTLLYDEIEIVASKLTKHCLLRYMNVSCHIYFFKYHGKKQRELMETIDKSRAFLPRNFPEPKDVRDSILC